MEIGMRQKERDRLKVLEQMNSGAMGTDQGATRLGVQRRQAQRALADYRCRGDGAARSAWATIQQCQAAGRGGVVLANWSRWTPACTTGWRAGGRPAC